MRFGVTTLVFSLTALTGFAKADQPQADGAAFVSLVYGFSFSAPAPLAVKEYAPESLSVGQPAPEDGFDAVADIRLYTAGKDARYNSFDAFALETLRNACAAVGPGEAVICTQAQQRQPFTTESGLTGEVLYLERIHETFATGETQIDGFGPILLFNLSGAATGAEFSALAVQPPANLEAAKIDNALLREVASSLSAGPRSQPD
jgi:hypothetical protein